MAEMSTERDKQAEQAKLEMAQRVAALRRLRGQDQPPAAITAGDLSQAQAVLAEIGGNVPIFVVPETWALQGDNLAVCVADGDQARHFTVQLEAGLELFEPEARTELPKAFTEKTILVKKSVLGLSSVNMRGIIWHEFGHSFLGAAENGDVFAHELSSLRKSFSKEEVKAYARDFRKVSYFARYAVDPGLEKLEQQMSELDLDLDGEKKKMAAEAKAAIQRKFKKGFNLSGDPASFQERIKADTPLPIDVPAAQAGTDFVWEGWVWIVAPKAVEYELEVVSSPREDLKPGTKIAGELERLKSRAGNRGDPAVADQPLDKPFDWEGASWKVVSRTDIHTIEMVEKRQG
jgi:hypothetical protein